MPRTLVWGLMLNTLAAQRRDNMQQGLVVIRT